MSYYENSGLRSYPRNDLILIPNNSSHYEQPQNIANKWNHFFLSGSNVEVDIDVSSSDSSKSVIHSSASSSCSSTSLDGSSGAERRFNTDNSPSLSPTGRDISLASGFAKRKSDGLCQITLSNKPSTLQHFINGQEFCRNNEMESSRLDDDSEEIDHYDALPTRISSRLNIEDFDRMERLKISNGENGMLKSVKGTVRGYKNMVRRYSASFNSKGHVIPPPSFEVSVHTLSLAYYRLLRVNILNVFRILGFKRGRSRKNYNLYDVNDSCTGHDRSMFLC